DEHRVPAFGEQPLEAVDALAADEFDAEVEDVVAFLVDDDLGQPEARDLSADHPPGLGVLVEDDAVVAEWRKVARDRERGRAAADQRDALAIHHRRALRQPAPDVVLEVGGDALEPADRDRLLLDPSAPTGRLTGTVAGAPEDAGEHVRLPIDHVGVAVATGRD